jgi:hypothetical protein
MYVKINILLMSYGSFELVRVWRWSSKVYVGKIQKIRKIKKHKGTVSIMANVNCSAT